MGKNNNTILYCQIWIWRYGLIPFKAPKQGYISEIELGIDNVFLKIYKTLKMAQINRFVLLRMYKLLRQTLSRKKFKKIL
jgi:hypothetical protein